MRAGRRRAAKQVSGKKQEIVEVDEPAPSLLLRDCSKEPGLGIAQPREHAGQKRPVPRLLSDLFRVAPDPVDGLLDVLVTVVRPEPLGAAEVPGGHLAGSLREFRFSREIPQHTQPLGDLAEPRDLRAVRIFRFGGRAGELVRPLAQQPNEQARRLLGRRRPV